MVTMGKLVLMVKLVHFTVRTLRVGSSSVTNSDRLVKMLKLVKLVHFYHEQFRYGAVCDQMTTNLNDIESETVGDYKEASVI